MHLPQLLPITLKYMLFYPHFIKKLNFRGQETVIKLISEKKIDFKTKTIIKDNGVILPIRYEIYKCMCT